MRTIELFCALIVAIYVTARVVRGRDADERARIVRRLAILAGAAFLGEDSVMRAYDFYRYAPAWDFFLDRTPLLIVLIWPVVVDSAELLAKRILGALDPRVPLLGAAFVLADASLIEPIAVRADLWRWSEDGLFEVPPIGILGWSFFAVAALAVFTSNDRARRGPLADLALFAIAPLATHVILVASWFGAFRWLRGPIAPWPAVVVAWAVLFSLAVLAWRRGIRDRVPRADLLVRMPGAAFFFALLALYGRDTAPLVVYAIAFAPPYFALLRTGSGRASGP